MRFEIVNILSVSQHIDVTFREQDVSNWGDCLRAVYHPRSVHKIHEHTGLDFSRYQTGLAALQECPSEKDGFIESVRWFAEDCDSVQVRRCVRVLHQGARFNVRRGQWIQRHWGLNSDGIG